MNSDISRFGSEFHYEILSVPKNTGESVVWHDASACITPETTETESLQKAWDLVQDLANWLKEKTKEKSDVENFRIIVGWSKEVRKQQGQIFKIWKKNEELDLIEASSSLEEYKEKTEDDWQAPLKGWQKDVFSKQEA